MSTVPNNSNMRRFSAQRRVEFAWTDAAGIMHFAAFFPLVEAVEHEFLRSLGLSVLPPPGQGQSERLSWPRVAARCDYHSAARFEDMLDIELSIARLGEKSVTYHYTIRIAGRDVATAEVTAVCCALLDHAPPSSRPIPDQWRLALTPYLVTAD